MMDVCCFLLFLLWLFAAQKKQHENTCSQAVRQLRSIEKVQSGSYCFVCNVAKTGCRVIHVLFLQNFRKA